MSKDTQSYNESQLMFDACLPIYSSYLQQAIAARQAKDTSRFKICISVLAALNPEAYKKYLRERKKES